MSALPSTPWWRRVRAAAGLPPMAHRPPLPQRWMVYCVSAYLAPIVLTEALPDGAGLYAGLSWLATLAPAFILALHFGMMGALASLLIGTVLYLVVQFVLELNFTPVSLDVVLAIYVSYGALAIAVGWLSQVLHDHYRRLMRAERVAAIGEVALTVRHEVNNALAGIVAEAGMLRETTAPLGPEDRQAVETILQLGHQVAADLRKLSTLEEAPASRYVGGVKLMDLDAVREGRSA